MIIHNTFLLLHIIAILFVENFQATEDEFNVYHEALLTWSFKKESSVQELITPMPHSGEWNIR